MFYCYSVSIAYSALDVFNTINFMFSFTFHFMLHVRLSLYLLKYLLTYLNVIRCDVNEALHLCYCRVRDR